MLPLEGVRVLELARVSPHYFCTMMLADMGADVLKIETPAEEKGNSSVTDQTPKRDPMQQITQAFNRNKRSISIDLKSVEGKQLFYKLAATADVVVDGFRPGVVKRLGVDYETLSRLNHKIIYCSISGYGQDGPYKLLPGHDINYISFAGALGLIGDKRGNPVIPLNFIGDFAGGTLHAVIGILLALAARQRTGRGQYVDISMTDAVVSMLSGNMSAYINTGHIPRAGEGVLSGAFPCYSVYKTLDNKYISLGCAEPHFWENLCRALGREDLIPYQWSKGKKREQVFNFMRRKFRTKTRDEWFTELYLKDIAISKVYSLDEVLYDPQIRHRQMVVEIDKPGNDKVTQVGIAIKLSETPGRIRSVAPFQGEHTDQVLKELGYSGKAIGELRQKGIVS